MLYVQASLLALHVNEQPDSATSHWARINTPVEVLDERGDMLQVKLLDRPDEHAITGWVVGEYLDTEAVTLRLATDQVREAQHLTQDDELVEQWTARRDALSPQWNREPDPTAFVGYCETDRVMLLGTLSEADGFTATPHADGTRRQLRELSAQHWLRITDGKNPEPIVGSPFVQPFATGTWNEEGRSAFAPGACDGICDDESENKVVLGPCEDPGALYVSSHVVEWTAPRNDEVRIEDGMGLWSVMAGPMRIEVQATFQDRYGDGTDVPPMPHRTWIQVGERRYAIVGQDGSNWGGVMVFEVTDRGVLHTTDIGLYGSGC